MSTDVLWTAACAATFGLLTTIWTLWWKPYLESKKPVQSVPMLPDSHWLFGHLFWLLGKQYLEKQQALVESADTSGRCSCWIGPTQASISLTCGEDAQKLLKNHHIRYSAPILQRHFEMLSGKRNLFLLNGKEWKYFQSALKSALCQKSKDDPTHLQRIVVKTTSRLVRNIQARIVSHEQNAIHCSSIDGFMKMITQDVFGLAAFSHDFACCSKFQLSEFAKAFESIEDDILDRCLRNALLPQNLCYWIPTQRNKTFLENRSLLRNFLSGVVHDRLSTRSRNTINKKKTPQRHDILDKLIEAHTEKQQQQQQHDRKESMVAPNDDQSNDHQNLLVNEEDLVDILLSVLLAGYDTVSIALTYAMFLISRHPHWEALCLKEIKEINGVLNFDDIAFNNAKKVEYPLCRAVILETLRLYPVATALSRNLEKSFQLPGNDDTNSSIVTVPKGCHVGISVWLIHRSERHFPKPLEFRPDRWVEQCPTTQRWVRRKQGQQPDSSASSSSSSSSFIPPGDSNAFFAFSAGARSCPGQSFALEEASLAFAVLIHDLKFQVDANYEAEMEWKVIVQKPKGGIPATISVR